MAPLTGKALLEKLKELGNMLREEQARVCGYTQKGRGGVERVNEKKFLAAIASAAGFVAADSQPEVSSPGRSATGEITVQAKGQVVIGPSYTSALKINPGDKLQVRVITKGRGAGKIELLPVVEEQDDEPIPPQSNSYKNGRGRRKELAIAR